jgi:aminocarboxymuconate-semialdehyde decarboxylase
MDFVSGTSSWSTRDQPVEEVIAMSHLIFGGVLDRFPDLRVCIAYGGGYFPYYVGRMDHVEVRPEVRRLIPEPRRPTSNG